MNPSDPDLDPLSDGSDPFTDALRGDLPSRNDEARLRARLVAAGALAGAGIVAPTAAASGSAGAGIFAKLVALPLSLKLGAAATATGLAAVPMVSHVSESGRSQRAEVRAAPVAAPAEPAPALLPSRPRAAPVPSVETSDPAPFSVQESPRQALRRPAREAAAAVAPAAPEPLQPAVQAFPIATAIDEGTLRAETALMERALSAIRSEDFSTARRELSAHAARFPNGHLAPERDKALERILGKETGR